VKERVFGIETEYAVIYSPGRGDRRRPTNLELYARFEAALRSRVRSLPRALSLLRAKQGRFLENGGCFHYEATPEYYEHGLIEISSPECRDPYVLLCYERDKDELVEELAVVVNEELCAAGYTGEVRIGKNNVDSQGNTFGSHESYWVEDPLSLVARLALLPLWLAVWIVSIPVVAWLVLAPLALLVGLIGSAVALLGTAAVLSPFRPETSRRMLAWLEARFSGLESRPGALVRRMNRLSLPLFPLLSLHTALYRRFHFRRLHRDLTAFLVTRTVYCGAGSVAFDGGPLLRLAQRPPFLRSLVRIFPFGEDRPLYEIRDLFFRPWSALASRRRLHLLIGDANLCEWAQALRVGATALVLEAIEAEVPVRWPVLRDPLEELSRLNADPDLGVELELVDGARAGALEIQRRYLAAVREALDARGDAMPLWKARVLRDWEETLDALERAPESLDDRLDWMAKRKLLLREVPDRRDREALRARGAQVTRDGELGSDADRYLRDLAFRARRVDFRYHELSPRGGYRRLERDGEIRRLCDRAGVERARREPPDDTRAWARGQAIKWAHANARSGGVAWHRARLGKWDWRWFHNPLDPQR
jgi:hypothetical protein